MTSLDSTESYVRIAEYLTPLLKPGLILHTGLFFLNAGLTRPAPKSPVPLPSKNPKKAKKAKPKAPDHCDESDGDLNQAAQKARLPRITVGTNHVDVLNSVLTDDAFVEKHGQYVAYELHYTSYGVVVKFEPTNFPDCEEVLHHFDANGVYTG